MKGEWDGVRTGTERGPSEGGWVSLSESGWPPQRVSGAGEAGP